MFDSAMISDEKAKSLNAKSMRVDIKTNFNFVRKHNGLRLGAVHLLIGTAGSGKSSITIGLIENIARLNLLSIAVWLTEEKSDDLRQKFNQLELNQDDASKIIITSDVDNTKNINHDHKKHIESIFRNSKMLDCKVLFIDNITTYYNYASANPSVQTEISWHIKSLAIKYNIAVFIVAHTKSMIPDNAPYELNESHIRGSSTIINIAEFIYVYQRFLTEIGYIGIVKNSKARKPKIKASDKINLLDFDNRLDIYKSDKTIPFEAYKKHFLSRLTL